MNWRWRIRQKLVVGLVLVIGMICLLVAGSLFGLRSYEKSNRVFAVQQRQLELLGYLEIAASSLNFPTKQSFDNPTPALVQQEKQERLERIERMLHKYRDGLVDAQQWFTKPSLDAQQAEILTMQGALDDLRDWYSGARTSVGANQPRMAWYVGNERDSIADLIYALERLRGLIHADVTRQVKASRTDYQLSQAAVYSTSVLVTILLLMLVYFAYRSIFIPIRQVHESVAQLAGGNFESRVHVDSGDELQDLGESFNNMADRLQGIYKDLNRQVEDRSRQLIRSERLASVGFLAAGVAHEINNPLASIAFCGEALHNRLAPFLEKTEDEEIEIVQNYLRMIQQEAFRCKTITEKLLDFSRAGDPERIDTDLVGLVRNTLDMAQHLGRSERKRLVFEPRGPVVARVNPQELKQVLLNLVVNALESIEDDGSVTIEVEADSEAATIRVRDTGCGMTAEVLQNLFEPFFTRSRSGKGTGLGLSISHLIISQHGGTLDAASQGPGLGSTFVIRLPHAAPIRLPRADSRPLGLVA